MNTPSFPAMYYCGHCDRNFNTRSVFYQHKINSPKHNWCSRCDRDFSEIDAYREHFATDMRHNLCDFCQEDFEERHDLEEHRDASHEHCKDCDKWMATEADMREHDKKVHNFCTKCNRRFSSMNALKNHLKSSVHVPKTVSCIGERCDEKFIHKAAMLLHIEEGGCKSGATRHTMDQSVAELDQDHFITNSNRTVTGPLQTWATERVRDEHSFKCYFCHKELRTLAGLNQHLASPAHKQPAYHCPSHLNHNCALHFKTLGALFQHIESGSCGAERVRPVRDKLDSIVQGIERVAVY